jgi:hypothetical protein
MFPDEPPGGEERPLEELARLVDAALELAVVLGLIDAGGPGQLPDRERPRG